MNAKHQYRCASRLHNQRRASRFHNHRRASRSGQRGYTLIEVIVAFALLAFGLGLLLAILSGGVRQVAWAGQATRAALYADTLMSTLGADARLQAGQRKGQFEHGNYRWTMDIVRDRVPVAPTNAANTANQNKSATPPAPPEMGDVTFRSNELYRIALELRWGDAPDQHLHIDTLRAYTPGPERLQ
jgi:general secretion pathway protein I